jgi:hypothetical protein
VQIYRVAQPLLAFAPTEPAVRRWLCRVLRGHYQYYGVIFNSRALRVFQTCVVKLWRKTLGKRSQKGHVTWASYNRLLTVFPLPDPVIYQAWHR